MELVEGIYSLDYGIALPNQPDVETKPYSRSYIWNEKNQLKTSVENGFVVNYRYGEDGQRAVKSSAQGETLYFNNMWQMSTTPMGMRQTKHIFVGETRIATKNNWWKDSGTEYERYNTYYFHSDHLGSAQLITDWRGEEYERIEYTPYGELWIEKVRDGFETINYRFTGKEMDSETGLYYFGARYLDPKYSRWLSCDPALSDYIPVAGKATSDEASKLPGVGGVFNSVNLNLYHYAENNPIKYTDPNGESGKLTIYSSGNSLFDGHSWISYIPDDTGETTTYGTWGNNPTGEGNGLFENLEQGYGAQATRTVQLNDKQEASLMKTINQYKERGENAWNLLGPCSKFAQDAWESATGEYLNANILIIVSNPETLKKSIIKANGNVSNGTLDIPNSSSGASSVGSNSVDRSSGSSSYSVGSTSNISSDPVYDSLTQ